jgi:hypothetical protein
MFPSIGKLKPSTPRSEHELHRLDGVGRRIAKYHASMPYQTQVDVTSQTPQTLK